MNLKLYAPRLRPYVFHGVHLSHHPRDNGATGVCPFCHDSTFFVYAHQNKDGYTCNSCLESGNVYTFLKTLYKYSQRMWDKSDKTPYLNPSEVKRDKLAAFMARKNLTLEDITRWGIIPSYTTLDPLLPLYNENDSLSNLCKLALITDKNKTSWRPIGTPNCKQHPYRLPGPQPYPAIWVVEGYSDTIAAERLVRTQNLDIDVMGLWGVNGFNPEFFNSYLHDKQTTFIFDNDYPKRTDSGKINYKAKDGIESICKMALALRPVPDIHYVHWGSTATYHDPKLPDGFDLSDLIAAEPAASIPQRINDMRRRPRPATSAAANAKKARDAKTSNSNKRGQTASAPPKPKEQIKPITCTSFKALCEHFKKRIHFTQQLEDTLAVMLSAVVSTPLDGDQLWFRIIGPPGSGKTTLAECITAAYEYVYPLSLNTGFHSGYQDPSDKEKDNSLLSKMNGKTTIIKDGDTLLKSSGLERILSEMRDYYDGVSRAKYRNGVEHNYEDLRITFLLCGTDSLRSLNRTDVGERFLDCEIFGDDDAKPYIERAFDNTFSRVTNSLTDRMEADSEAASEEDRTFLKAVTAGFVNHLRTNMARRQPPHVSPHAREAIMGMAEFIAIVRAKTRRDKDTEEFTKSRVEVPTRLVSQLAKQAICTAIVKERSSIDEEVLRVSRKITFDTVESVELDVVKILHDDDTEGTGLSCRQIAAKMHLSERAVIHRLEQLRYFGAIVKKARTNNSGQRGRDVHHWMLSDRLKEVYRTSLDPAEVSKPATLSKSPLKRPPVTRPKPKMKVKS